MDSAVYLYCLVQARQRPSLARVRGGVPGAGSPRLLEAGRSLWLVAADAPLAQYGEEALESGLREFEWVSRCAIGHEAMVESFAEKMTVVPMKLFTLFTTDERAVAHIARRRRTIDRALARIAEAQEWGVRVTETAAPAGAEKGSGVFSHSRPVSASSGKQAAVRGKRLPTPSLATSGTDFLKQKQQARRARHDRSARAQAAAASHFSRLATQAREARRLPRTPAPGTRGPLLDAAFLVPGKRRTRFRSAVRTMARELAPLGCAVTLTGPWPPYNFIKGA